MTNWETWEPRVNYILIIPPAAAAHIIIIIYADHLNERCIVWPLSRPKATALPKAIQHNMRPKPHDNVSR